MTYIGLTRELLGQTCRIKYCCGFGNNNILRLMLVDWWQDIVMDMRYQANVWVHVGE